MVILAIKNIQIRPKGDGSYSDVLHPETNAGQVKFTDGTTVEEHKAENATSSNKGHVQIGSGLSISNGIVSHPTTAGNKHIPSGGANGQSLIYGGTSGTAVWGMPSLAGKQVHIPEFLDQGKLIFDAASDKWIMVPGDVPIGFLYNEGVERDPMSITYENPAGAWTFQKQANRLRFYNSVKGDSRRIVYRSTKAYNLMFTNKICIDWESNYNATSSNAYVSICVHPMSTLTSYDGTYGGYNSGGTPDFSRRINSFDVGELLWGTFYIYVILNNYAGSASSRQLELFIYKIYGE